MVLSMIKSIQHFGVKGVKNLEILLEKFAKNPKNHADFVYGITENVIQLGLDIITETLEEMDECLRESGMRKNNWQIVRRDETTLITSLGSVKYKKTLFKNKKTKSSEYLLDRIMELDSHVRITEDAEAIMLEEAVESSYRKGGLRTSITDKVSKQTVKNKIHRLHFNEQPEELKNKKKVPYIYIDADEDHVAMQYLDKKGDIKKPRSNTAMPKIVYVYEGIKREHETSTRRKLVNAKYFGGMYEGSEGVERLWKEVSAYLEATYEMDEVKQVYINGDGANWIKSGRKYIYKSKFVLDKFHIQKYIISATSHLLDSAEDARAELYQAIHKRLKWMAQGTFEKILSVTESESKRKKVERSMKYILGNWSGIMHSISNKENQMGCSAEGHVSHIFADRMSSRPLGWSKHGVNQMAKLRIYKANDGDMLELVRKQKEVLPMAAGLETEIACLSSEVTRLKKTHFKESQRYVETITHSIPYPQIKKIAYLKNHIWGL